ncbi:hypothetical protein TNCV_4316361 [Trichonephila clavipes]|nr:hypothetical protein TNCV_4316361 [Trichonephila clavipes]
MDLDIVCEEFTYFREGDKSGERAGQSNSRGFCAEVGQDATGNKQSLVILLKVKNDVSGTLKIENSHQP